MEQRIPLQNEAKKIIELFDKPEYKNMRFDRRLLKKWAVEYKPKLPSDHIDYIVNRVIIISTLHKMKREDPVKYQKWLEEKRKRNREYNKLHPDIAYKANRRRYEKIKQNPILFNAIKNKQREYQKKRREDPEFREKQKLYQKEYLKKMKAEDPEKYREWIRIHRKPMRTTGGVKCPNCGFGIKTSTAGKNLGKRPIQCPRCRFFFPKNQSERIRIPRILSVTSTEIKKHRREFDSMAISEKALEGLKNLEKLTSNDIDENDYGKVRNMWNLGMAFQDEMKNPKEIVGKERKVAENIKKRMIEFVDEEEMKP